MRNNIQAADRILQMLLAFSEDGQVFGVGSFASILGVHKSTASRLAATLAKRGFLEQDPRDRSFRLGPALSRLGLLALGSRELLSLSREAMESLAAKTQETVNLGLLDGSEVVNVAQVDSQHIVGIGAWTGRRTQLHCTSNGKVFLAFAGASAGMPPYKAFTRRTITSPKILSAQLELIRRDGWACTVGELEDGLHAVAVPIFDSVGRCRAALSVSGPAYRLPAKRFPALAKSCQQEARKIEVLLGRSNDRKV